MADFVAEVMSGYLCCSVSDSRYMKCSQTQRSPYVTQCFFLYIYFTIAMPFKFADILFRSFSCKAGSYLDLM